MLRENKTTVKPLAKTTGNAKNSKNSVLVYLTFEKALKYCVSRKSIGLDVAEDKKQAFSDICNEIVEIWACLDDIGKSAFASELVAQGINNSVLHYQLYGRAKETWSK